jgi:hypothetical protein
MGKLLFVHTNRIYGWWGVILCIGAIAGGIYGAFAGTYAALGFTILGALALKVCLRLATQRTELFEAGFTATTIFDKVSARYADLKSIGRTGVVRNGVTNTLLVLTTNDGKHIALNGEAFLKRNAKMEELLDRTCSALADTWQKRLEKEKVVGWIMNGSKAVLRISKEGVLVEGNAAGLIPLDQFQTKPGIGAVAICKGEERMLTVNAGAPNFYTGMFLIEMLRQGSQKSMTAQASH